MARGEQSNRGAVPRERPAKSKSNSGKKSRIGAGDKSALKLCLVIAPFDVKADPVNPDHKIDFESVYDDLIKPSLQDDYRVDKMNRADGMALIHTEMLAKIIRADLVIADITFLNPNVLYELGVRHTARRSGTIVISQSNTPPPFDIGMVRCNSYSYDGIEDQVEREIQLAEDREMLRAAARSTLRRRTTDSPVFEFTPNLNVVRRPEPLDDLRYALVPITKADHIDDHTTPVPDTLIKMPTSNERASRHLGVLTGDLQYLRNIAHVWVNPENHRFEMSPLHEATVSAFVRVLGAGIGAHGEIGDDYVAKELKGLVRGEAHPGFAVMTGPGRLKDTHGVRAVVHVAAQVAEPLSGYYTMNNYQRCVASALTKVDEANAQITIAKGEGTLDRQTSDEIEPCSNQLRFGHDAMTSVLFPLFGTRGRQRDPAEVAFKIVQEAKRHLDLVHTLIEKVYFLATSDVDLDLCETAFSRLGLGIEDPDWYFLSRGRAGDLGGIGRSGH